MAFLSSIGQNYQATCKFHYLIRHQSIDHLDPQPPVFRSWELLLAPAPLQLRSSGAFKRRSGAGAGKSSQHRNTASHIGIEENEEADRLANSVHEATGDVP